jgi:hypothetical protein
MDCYPWVQDVGPGALELVGPEELGYKVPLPTMADIEVEAERSADLASLPVVRGRRPPVGEEFILAMTVDMGGIKFESGTTIIEQPTAAVVLLMNRLRERVIRAKAAGAATAQLALEKEFIDAEFGGEFPDIVAVRLGLDPNDLGAITCLTGLEIYDEEGDECWTGQGCLSCPRSMSATCPDSLYCLAKGYELIPTAWEDGKITEASIERWEPPRFKNEPNLPAPKLPGIILRHEWRHNNRPGEQFADRAYAAASRHAPTDMDYLRLRGDWAVGWMPAHLRTICLAHRTALRAYELRPTRTTLRALEEAARQYAFMPVPKPLYGRMCKGLRMPKLHEIRDVEASRT